MSKKSVLIFSGSNPRAIVTFCRYATEQDIPFYIVADGDTDKILQTVYKNKVIANRTEKTLTLPIIEKYTELVRKQEGVKNLFILPSSEYLNRVLLKNKKRLKLQNIDIGLCEKELYKLISDKDPFCNICQAHGIRTPAILDEVPVNGYFIIKPKTYETRDGKILKPVIVKNNKNVEKYQELIQHPDTFIHEYIGGESFYLLFYISTNRKDYSIYSQKNLMQQYNGRSIVLAKSASIHTEEIGNKFVDLFIKLSFSGLVMVEVKKYKDQYYMIEANPRPWGPLQLIMDSGMDLLDRFAFENELITEVPERTYHDDTWYYWSGGILEDQNNLLEVDDHEFSKEDFFNHLSSFQANDIYAREDTLDLYKNENKLQ